MSVLELAVYAKTSIFPPIREIWKYIEFKGFDDKDDREFALEIMKYMAALMPSKDAYAFFSRIVSLREKMHYEFMPLTLIVKSHESIDNLPILVNEFTKHGWSQKEKSYELQFMIENLLFNIGLDQISEQLSSFDPLSYWFIEKLFQSQRVKLSYTENSQYYCIDKISDVEAYIPFDNEKYYYDFKNLLSKLYHFDDIDEEIMEEIDIDIIDRLDYFATSQTVLVEAVA